jgi:hypothetical protein
MKEMTPCLVLTDIYTSIHVTKTVNRLNSNTEIDAGYAQVFACS